MGELGLLFYKRKGCLVLKTVGARALFVVTRIESSQHNFAVHLVFLGTHVLKLCSTPVAKGKIGAC